MQLTYIITYSIEHKCSWEANMLWASQEIPLNLYNKKVHYRIHKWQPPVPILSQISPLHTSTSIFLKTNLPLNLPSGLTFQNDIFPLCFLTKIPYTSLLSRIISRCPALLFLHDFINRKILGEVYRQWSPSLSSFLHSLLFRPSYTQIAPQHTIFYHIRPSI